ncbi:2-octaprenyl-3-methyl-6-methoxy-1,4-benzoquinol hydroxylase [Candidatus Photodesmus blepharus]|uniref:2-octaprenyl-3-methyl-6-methoxy-1,4-benzoquinol hydroxylase n=1 Tax=Candidatus Photodesmus blepharonis TaxID=1179155 RepID=A0A084CPJ9_9GAMM|nr:2-octaprenyl-3-methyl-6-methoxy-1,4-benzoquinol hydroxylase [Candidatus Photodesmus blepharus]KEY91728.1 2-octaprenyl-3-methyl-6-methoxy-1,4-benzoquinol hydroxylase [Candidatus Photodesmus blepharus]
MKNYDVAVIGRGMVGSAVALGFVKQGRRVAIVENDSLSNFSPSQPIDIRVSAISQCSVHLLDRLGAWSSITKMRVCPYRRLETWCFPECRIHFDSKAVGLSQLGYIIENRVIQLGLISQFSKYLNLVVYSDELKGIQFKEDRNILFLKSGEKFSAMWVIGADGKHSRVRQLANIGITAWDYRQHCISIGVNTDLPQQDIAWQHFTPTGPRSFLPLCGNQGSLVWYDSPERIKQLCAMNSKQLRSEILCHFPKELGDIKVLQKGAFSLTRRHAQKYSNKRCVLVGDSAHTINPLAGQGVNISFKDVVALLEVTSGVEILSNDLLVQYELRRRPDNLLMQTGIDLLYKGFSNDFLPLKLARNVMFKLVDSSEIIKRKVLKYALGL